MTFYYVNSLGYKKAFIANKLPDGEYEISLWDVREGQLCEFCGGGTTTKAQIEKFLKHYGKKLKDLEEKGLCGTCSHNGYDCDYGKCSSCDQYDRDYVRWR